jgi:DNA-directed RNA polymerase specialized sigma24 family protein
MEYLKGNKFTFHTLFYLQKLSVKEIVLITSYSESQVKILFHRVRKKHYSVLKKMTDK